MNIVFTSIIMLLAINNNLFSQDVDCDPCPAEPWTTAFTYTIISGCPVQIEYEYKSCDDYQLSFRLVSVEYDDTYCTIGLSVLMDKAAEELMKEINRYKLMFGTPDDLEIMLALPQCLENSGSDKFEACGPPTPFCCKEFTTTWAADTIKTIDVSSTYTDNCGILMGGCDYSYETIDDISTGPIPYNPEGLCGTSCPNIYNSKSIDYVNGSCTLTIGYLHRTNCQSENEITIESVVTTGSCSSYNSSDSIIKRSVNEILKAESSSSTTFTFVVNSCWNKTSFGSRDVWQRCVPSSCCEIEYEVTYNDPDTEIDSYSITQSNTCTVIGCSYVCDDDHLEPLADGSNVLLKPSFDLDIRTLTTSNKVIPNPSTGLTKFILDSPEEGNISLVIYDILGNILLTENVIKETYHKEMSLDLSNLNEGTYYFKYKFEGQIITNGSFVIMK